MTMRRRIAPLALMGAATLILTGCGALGGGTGGGASGGGADYDAKSLKQRVEELAKENGGDGIVALDLYLSGGSGGVNFSTPEGIVGKTLDTGEDRYSEPIAPPPNGTIPVADYPYDELIERAGAEDLGCDDGAEPRELRTSVMPAGGLFMSVRCDEGTGKAWLDDEEMESFDDVFSEEAMSALLEEMQRVSGSDVIEVTAMGPDGPLGDDVAGIMVIGAEQEFFGEPCEPMLNRPVNAEGEMFNIINCNDTTEGTAFSLEDYTAADFSGALEFGMQHLGLESTDEIASARMYVEENGMRFLQITGTELSVMTTVSLDEG